MYPVHRDTQNQFVYHENCLLLRSEEYVILKKEEWMKERIDIS